MDTLQRSGVVIQVSKKTSIDLEYHRPGKWTIQILRNKVIEGSEIDETALTQIAKFILERATTEE